MKIDRLVLGAYQTNCYILRSSNTVKDCLIVDTGLEAGELVEFLKRHKLNPVALVLTHGHVDHIAGMVELRKNFPNVKVYIHKLDAEMLTKAESNISTFTGMPFSTEPADFLIEEGSVIEQAAFEISSGGIKFEHDRRVMAETRIITLFGAGLHRVPSLGLHASWHTGTMGVRSGYSINRACPCI